MSSQAQYRNTSALPAPAPPLPSRSARTQSHFTTPLCAVPLAQSFCHEPSNISTLTEQPGYYNTSEVPGPFCVCSRRHDEMIKSAPAVCSSASSASAHPSCNAQARSRVRKDGLPLRPRSYFGPFSLRPCSHPRPCPLCRIPSRRIHLGTISPVGAAVETPSTLLKEPAGVAELREQIAELTAEKAAYAGRASCTRHTASCTSCHVPCNAPATRRRRHQHLPRSKPIESGHAS